MRFATRDVKSGGKSLRLKLHVSQVDVNGKFTGKTDWISSDDKHKQLKLEGDDDPLTQKPDIFFNIYNEGERFIEFTHSSIDTDAAQTTIPFFDAQSVTLNPPVPLSGIGLYYKSQSKSGGFIGPQIYAYNYSGYIVNNEFVAMEDKPELLVGNVLIYSGIGLAILVFLLFFGICLKKSCRKKEPNTDSIEADDSEADESIESDESESEKE